jgi:hypothetical protein
MSIHLNIRKKKFHNPTCPAKTMKIQEETTQPTKKILNLCSLNKKIPTYSLR